MDYVTIRLAFFVESLPFFLTFPAFAVRLKCNERLLCLQN